MTRAEIVARFGDRSLLGAACAAFFVFAGPTALAQETAPPETAPVSETAPVPTTTQSAIAKEDATELETLEVTGSRIKGVDLEAAQPVIVIDRKAIERTGITSTGELVRRLAIAAPSLTNTAPLAASGQVEVNLRNLGSQRVLVLVNGRRWVSGVNRSGISDAVDLTTIPLAIVDRIEILKDGAAAIYGSDALAGVVNIITRKTWEGVDFDTQWGQFTEGDGDSLSHSLTLGATTPKATTILNASYTRVDPFFESDREITNNSTFGFPDVNAYGASGTTRYGRYIVPGRPEPSLTLRTGEDGREASDFRAFNNLIDGEDTSPFSYVQTPRDTRSVFGAASYKLLDNLSLNGELLYNNRESNQFIAPIPIGLGIGPLAFLPGSSVVVHETNVFNPFGVRIGDPTTGGGNVARRIIETGPRRFFQDIDTYHVGLGLAGDVAIWSGNTFNWDVNYHYSRVHNSQTTTGQGNIERIARAVGPSANCTGTEPIPCVPLNLFGAPGSITQPMLDYAFAILNGRQEQLVQGYSANGSLPLFALPAGQVMMAAGYEYREEEGEDVPDPLETLGISTGNNRKPTSGSFDLKEFFAELQVPLLNDVFLANRLDLNVAARRSTYQIQTSEFSVTTGKGGLQYRPIEDLLLRVSYAEGFKAPTISNLFGGGSDNFATIGDPCNNVNFAGLSAAGQAQCIADGVPAGGYTQANPQIRISSGAGNRNLLPEEGESFIYGLVYSPDFVTGLTTSVDVWSYEIENTISLVGGQTVLDNCYRRGISSFCSFVTRNPGGGNVAGLNDGFVNFATTKTNGADGRIDYTLPVLFDGAYGTFRTELDVAYLDKYTDILPTFTGSFLTAESQGRATFNNALPRIKGNFGVSWSLANWGASYLFRYIGEVTENCGKLVTSSPTAATDRAQAGCYVGLNEFGVNEARFLRDRPAMMYHDVQASYDVAPLSSKITFGINNLLDDDPPPAYASGTGSGGFSPFLYDIPGQSYYLRLAVSFR